MKNIIYLPVMRQYYVNKNYIYFKKTYFILLDTYAYFFLNTVIIIILCLY